MTWEIFLGLAALSAFIIGIVTPLLKLNTAITRLTVIVEQLTERVKKLEKE